MKRTMWGSVLVILLVVVAAACGGSHRHAAPNTTVAVPQPVASSTTVPGQIDTSVVPPVITVPYVNAVLAKLNAIYSDATRSLFANKSVTETVETDFHAIFSAALYDQEVASMQQVLKHLPEVRQPIGQQIQTVGKLFSRTSHCVFLSVHTDDSQILVRPGTGPASEYYSLVRKDPRADPTHLNPTPWMYGETDASLVATSAQDPCTGRQVGP